MKVTANAKVIKRSSSQDPWCQMGQLTTLQWRLLFWIFFDWKCPAFYFPFFKLVKFPNFPCKSKFWSSQNFFNLVEKFYKYFTMLMKLAAIKLDYCKVTSNEDYQLLFPFHRRVYWFFTIWNLFLKMTLQTKIMIFRNF